MSGEKGNIVCKGHALFLVEDWRCGYNRDSENVSYCLKIN